MKKLQYRPLILSVNIWPQRGSSINQGIKRPILYLLHCSRRFRGCYEIKAPPWDVSARMRASGTTHAAHSLAVKSAKGRKNTFTFFGQILFLPPSFLPSLFSSFRNVTAAWDALVGQQEKAALLILCQFATVLTFKADATLSQLLAVGFDDCGNHLCFKVTIFTYIATRWCHLCKALVLQGFSFAIYFRTFYGYGHVLFLLFFALFWWLRRRRSWIASRSAGERRS